jgi:hypothetical protein
MSTIRCSTTTASVPISGDRLELHFGAEARKRYFSIFEELREQVRIADYLGSLQAFRAASTTTRGSCSMSDFLLEYPFAELVYLSAGVRGDRAPAQLGAGPVVLSDGDVVFQPRKIKRSGIWDAVEGRVMIYVHKERVLDHVQRRYPASHYVIVDDKPNSAGGDEDRAGIQTHHGVRAAGPLCACRRSKCGAAFSRPGDRAHRRDPDSQLIATLRCDHDHDAKPARLGTEPVARQHHSRNTRRRHACAVTSTNFR